MSSAIAPNAAEHNTKATEPRKLSPGLESQEMAGNFEVFFELKFVVHGMSVYGLLTLNSSRKSRFLTMDVCVLVGWMCSHTCMCALSIGPSSQPLKGEVFTPKLHIPVPPLLPIKLPMQRDSQWGIKDLPTPGETKPLECLVELPPANGSSNSGMTSTTPGFKKFLNVFWS